MEYEGPFAVERKKGLQVKELIRWLESCDLEDVFQLQEATILFLGHDALLRSGELLGGLRVKDVVWTEGGIGVWLARSKANRAGDGELITVPYYSETCAVSLMRKWFMAMGFWEKGKQDSLLFPGRRRGGKQFDLEKTISQSWLRVRIKKAAIYLGLRHEDYSGHSLRAGGATDLFVMRVPYYLIKKMGRWKSDAAMLCYRSDQDVFVAVKKAFKRLAVSGGG